MELTITANGISDSTFRFRERRWIENDQIILCLRLLGGAQELKNILLDPFHVQAVSRSISSRGGNILRIFLHAGYFNRSGSSTSQRECTLIREAVEHTPVLGVSRNHLVVLFL